MTTTKRCAAVIVAGLLAAGTPSAQDIERLFKAAVNTETVDRNCKGAIEQYRTVAAGPNRPLAAQALLRIAECYLEDGTLRSLTLPGDDGSLPFVTQGVAIALSPDGKTLAVAFRGNKSATTRLATMDINDGNYRELTSAFTNDTLTDTLVWSRDGQSIFIVDRADPGGDRLMRVSKGGGTRVFTGVRVPGLRSFDVSPDGTRLVYGTSNAEGAGSLHATLDVKSLLRSRP